MTIGELRKLLASYPSDLIVICQGDGEGNDYSPLADIWSGAYVPDSTWSGEAWLDKLTPELEKAGYGDEDVRIPGHHEDAVAAIFLSPTN